MDKCILPQGLVVCTSETLRNVVNIVVIPAARIACLRANYNNDLY